MQQFYRLFLLFLLIVTSKTQAQNLNNIFEDAQKLRTFINAGPPPTFNQANSATWMAIFENYYGGTVTDVDDLNDELQGNPFNLAAYIPAAMLNPNAPIRQGLAPGAAPSFNSFSAPSFANALTQVIIQRAKEELTATFFQVMKKELAKNPELATLFPKTAAFINNIDSYLYAGFLNTLRQAFVQDISNLNTEVKPFLNSPRIKSYIDNHPNLKFVYLSIPLSNFAAGIAKKEGLGNSIKYLYPDPDIKAYNENVYSTLAIFATISESVRDATGKNDWITFADFNAKILADPITTNLFFGLLYESIKGLNINGHSVGALFGPANKDNVVAIFKSLFAVARPAQAALASIKNKLNNAKSLSADDIEFVAQKSFNLLQTILTNLSKFSSLSKDDIARAQAILNSCQSMLQVANNISQSNYSSAVMNFLIMATDLLSIKQTAGVSNSSTTAVKTQLTAIAATLQSSDISDKKSIIKKINKANTNIKTTTATFNTESFMQKLLKYGSFMSAIAEATTPDQLNAAIDAAILPTGSSSIKHYSSFSISLNSYIGAGYYKEKYNSGSPDHIKTTLPTLGVSLPVGVGFNFGLRCKIIGSASVFVSVIDLGAIASFKLSTPDSVESNSLPNFTWQNLLAPGAYLVLGRILNTPLSLGFGAQRGPQLRSITYNTTSGTTVDLSSKEIIRCGAFLSVDIPLFNIYSKAWEKPLPDQ